MKISHDLHELIRELHHKYRVLKEQEPELSENGPRVMALLAEADRKLDEAEGVSYE